MLLFGKILYIENKLSNSASQYLDIMDMDEYCNIDDIKRGHDMGKGRLGSERSRDHPKNHEGREVNSRG